MATLDKIQTNLKTNEIWRTAVNGAIVEVGKLINKTASLQGQIDDLRDIAVQVVTNTNQIAANTKSLAEIESPGWVTSDRIRDGTVQAVDISTGAITADKLAVEAVTTDKIAASSVTLEKVDFFLDDNDLDGGNTKVPSHDNVKNYINSNIATATFNNKRLYTFQNTASAVGGYVSNVGHYAAYSPSGFTFPISCSDHNLTKITYHGVNGTADTDDNQQVMGTVIIDWVARKLKQSSVRSANRFDRDLAHWYLSSTSEATGTRTYLFSNSGEWGNYGKEGIVIDWYHREIDALPCLCSRRNRSGYDIFKWSFCIEKV